MTIEEAFNLAFQHHQAGRMGQAEAIYREILKQSPDHPHAQHMLGVLAHQAGRHQPALDLVSRAIAVEPNIAAFHCNHGLILAALGRHADAAAAYEKALALDPNLYEAHYNLGGALTELRRFDPAIEHLKRAIVLRPDVAYTHNNLGNALAAAGDYPAAIAAFERAIALRPDYPDAHNNLGFTYFTIGELEKAIACFNRALELRPDSPGYLTNLANALHKSRRLDQAMAAYQQALTISPQFPLTHWNIGLHYLLCGDYHQGWPEFEWRWQVEELDIPRVNLPRSPWDGGDLFGRRILLHGEQGFGDVIQFARYLPLVAQTGGKIVLCVQAELLPLLRNLPNVEEAVAIGQPLPEFEVYCSLLTLPGILHTTLENLPSAVPYLHADMALVEQWRSRLPSEGRPKIGLAWQGKKTPDPFRSIPFEKLAPLFENSTVQFISLQPGPADALPGLQTEHCPLLTDFAQTAALIANLDRVISIDSAAAHLAGALGKPAWTLLKYVPDWRWMLDRQDSPWYPTMRLFRQPVAGDWDSVVAQIAAALRKQFP